MGIAPIIIFFTFLADGAVQYVLDRHAPYHANREIIKVADAVARELEWATGISCFIRSSGLKRHANVQKCY